MLLALSKPECQYVVAFDQSPTSEPQALGPQRPPTPQLGMAELAGIGVIASMSLIAIFRFVLA